MRCCFSCLNNWLSVITNKNSRIFTHAHYHVGNGARNTYNNLPINAAICICSIRQARLYLFNMILGARARMRTANNDMRYEKMFYSQHACPRLMSPNNLSQYSSVIRGFWKARAQCAVRDMTCIILKNVLFSTCMA